MEYDDKYWTTVNEFTFKTASLEHMEKMEKLAVNAPNDPEILMQIVSYYYGICDFTNPRVADIGLRFIKNYPTAPFYVFSPFYPFLQVSEGMYFSHRETELLTSSISSKI